MKTIGRPRWAIAEGYVPASNQAFRKPDGPRKEPPDHPPPRKDPAPDEPPVQEPDDEPEPMKLGNDELGNEGDVMMTFLAASMFALLIITALYAFGIFGTPYLDAFRFAFYLILVILLVVIVFTLGHQPNEGYDPTPNGP